MKKKIIICAVLSAAMAAAAPAALAEKVGFSDVSEGHWAYEYIIDMAEQGIIEGYDDGSFLPEKTVTRAEFSKMLAGAAALSPVQTELADVDNNAWYAVYAKSASEYLMPQDGLFMPESEAKRKDIAAAIARIKCYAPDTAADAETRFSDIAQLTEEEKGYIAAAAENGIMDGFDEGVFRPEDGITRAQAAAILSRAFGDSELTAVRVGNIKVNINDLEKYAYLRVGGAQNISEENRVVVMQMAADEVKNVLIFGEIGKAAVEEGLPEEYAREVENIKQQAALYENVPSIAFLDTFYTAAAYEEVLEDMYITEMLDTTDEEVEKLYYNANYFRAKHILVEDEAQAAELLSQVQSGADFDELMNKYSSDPGTAYYPDGYVFTYNEMVPEFEECVKNTEIGGFGLCRSDYGWHVIARLPLPEDYSDIKEELEQAMINEYINDRVNNDIKRFGITSEINWELVSAVG
ncbi:MAG: S-layer homology domain-containing protein [Candidatus Ornithomonoglobus sp.]